MLKIETKDGVLSFEANGSGIEILADMTMAIKHFYESTRKDYVGELFRREFENGNLAKLIFGTDEELQEMERARIANLPMETEQAILLHRLMNTEFEVPDDAD